ncbi:MAG: NAD(P)-binding protein [Alphaproteobacteria bacterium]|jgi:predicted NAD/FAD-binding protein|nr:NAD(P)-binding protein [Alphaproteobacteria bacterium]
MKRIAIIGSGISGLGAAYALRNTADVTLYEARGRLGGHSHTLRIDHGGEALDVDVGFIVYNGRNYPNLTGLFDALDVVTQPSDMSFSVSDPDGYEWASSSRGIFAQKRNLFSPRFHRFWRTILKFNDVARAQLAAGEIGDVALRVWLDENGFDQVFRDNYILPMAAAIWSTPERGVLDFPARSFFEFFENHRLMHKERPKWRTVTGGSQTYVKRIGQELGDRVRLANPVRRVAPFGQRVKVTVESGQSDVFDEVILACHSDQALAILDTAYDTQRFNLASVRYRPNQVYLHRDARLMPKRRAAWASWNVLKGHGEDVCLSYWMNRLQSLPERCATFVTLNPLTPPADDTVFAELSFDHPQFDGPAEAAVRELKRLQGSGGIWFAGAWMGRGFHEDGLKSGLSPALSLGGQVPWNAEGVEIVSRQQDTAPVQLVGTATN